MKVVSLIAFAALAVAASGDEASLRATVQSELLANDPVCSVIQKSDWWKARKDRKDPKKNTVELMDKLCSTYNYQVDKCKSVSKYDVVGDPNYGTPIRCEVVGANSHLCRGNPCNHLNDGFCDIASTRGECTWFKRDWVTDFNKFWKPKQGEQWAKDVITSAPHGCYRNPCNMAGYGKPKDAANICSGLSVPGLYSCTWCSIRGEGMGCQMVDARGVSTAGQGPSAECAWANGAVSNKIYASGVETGNPAKPWVWNEGGRCQCDANFALCSTSISGSFGIQYRIWG